MNIDLNYYEIELGYKNDGADCIEYESPFSICVLTKYFPDSESVIDFCRKHLKMDYDYLHCITRISAEEQKEEFADRTYRIMTSDERRELRYNIRSTLNHAIVSDYLESILNSEDHETGESFVDAVIDDVKTNSAWHDDGYYSSDDIRFAIGRELMARLGVEV